MSNEERAKKIIEIVEGCWGEDQEPETLRLITDEIEEAVAKRDREWRYLFYLGLERELTGTPAEVAADVLGEIDKAEDRVRRECAEIVRSRHGTNLEWIADLADTIERGQR